MLLSLASLKVWLSMLWYIGWTQSLSSLLNVLWLVSPTCGPWCNFGDLLGAYGSFVSVHAALLGRVHMRTTCVFGWAVDGDVGQGGAHAGLPHCSCVLPPSQLGGGEGGARTVEPNLKMLPSQRQCCLVGNHVLRSLQLLVYALLPLQVVHCIAKKHRINPVLSFPQVKRRAIMTDSILPLLNPL